MCKPHSSIYSLPTSSYDALGHDDIPVWGSAKGPRTDNHRPAFGRRLSHAAGECRSWSVHLPRSWIFLPALANTIKSIFKAHCFAGLGNGQTSDNGHPRSRVLVFRHPNKGRCSTVRWSTEGGHLEVVFASVKHPGKLTF